MSDKNRVFITGYGALTACGANPSEAWDAVQTGQSGIAPIEHWDLPGWQYPLGGEIKQFQPAKLLPDRKLMKVISRQDVMGIHAAIQAVEHSQFIQYRDTLADSNHYNEQTAVYVGSPGNKYFQQYDFLKLVAEAQDDMKVFAEKLFNEVHPMWLLRILPNNVLAYTGMTYGFKGPNHNFTNHAVGSMQAIIEAYHAIQMGYAQRAVVVGYDMGVEPQALFYYEKLGLISKKHLKPFDAQHDGTILAEGAAALVLESEASAAERNAACYAEIVAGQSSTEAAGLFSIEDSGQQLASLLKQMLQNANVSPEVIDLVVAHGNGNKKSDETEALALQQVLPGRPVTAFKWATGHTIAASGIVDSVLATVAMQHHQIPGIGNFDSLAEACSGVNISAAHRYSPEKMRYAMIVNRGFGAMNASILLRGCA